MLYITSIIFNPSGQEYRSKPTNVEQAIAIAEIGSRRRPHKITLYAISEAGVADFPYSKLFVEGKSQESVLEELAIEGMLRLRKEKSLE